MHLCVWASWISLVGGFQTINFVGIKFATCAEKLYWSLCFFFILQVHADPNISIALVARNHTMGHLTPYAGLPRAKKGSLHKVYSFTRQYEVNICGVGPHGQIHGSLPFSPAGSVGRFGTWDWESHHALGHLQVTWWFQRKIHNICNIFGFNHMAYHQTRDFAAMFLPTSNLIQKPPQTGRLRAPLVELHGGFADVWPGWAQGAGFAGTCHCERPSDPEKLGS